MKRKLFNIEARLERLADLGFDRCQVINWVTNSGLIRIGCSKCSVNAFDGLPEHDKYCPNRVEEEELSK